MSKLSDRFAAFWSKRTAREKVISVVAVVVLSVTLGYPALVQPVLDAFGEQSRELEKLRKAYEETPKSLERYAKLVSRRKDIDSFYNNADLSAEPLSYIEGLLKTTAQAAGTYNVTPKEGVQLGGKYAHRFFDVNFQTSSYENLVAFLKALTSGKQPMLISKMDLVKSGGAQILTVKLEVSGFEPIGK